MTLGQFYKMTEMLHNETVLCVRGRFGVLVPARMIAEISDVNNDKIALLIFDPENGTHE